LSGTDFSPGLPFGILTKDSNLAIVFSSGVHAPVAAKATDASIAVTTLARIALRIPIPQSASQYRGKQTQFSRMLD
jgi:hypothetical protein